MISVAAGNHVHTAVLYSRIIKSNPTAEDSRGGEGPAVEILVEPEMTVVLWRFGDDVIMPQTELRRLQERLSDSSYQRMPHRFFVVLISLPHVDVLREDSWLILSISDFTAVPDERPLLLIQFQQSDH